MIKHINSDRGIFFFLGWVDVTPEERIFISKKFKELAGKSINSINNITYMKANGEEVTIIGFIVSENDVINGLHCYENDYKIMLDIEAMIHVKMMRSPQLETFLSLHVLYDECMD